MLVYMQSLSQGKLFLKNIKEGFGDKSNPYEDTTKKMKSLSQEEVEINGKSVTDAMNDFKDNYQKLFCLKAEGSNFTTQVNDGEGIGNLAGSGKDGGTCVRPVKNVPRQYTDKILKSVNGNYWYVNNYGYIKRVGNGLSGINCEGKEIVNTNHNDAVFDRNPQSLGLLPFKHSQALMEAGVVDDSISSCDSGNYNLQFTQGTNTHYAYLSPSGQVKKYGGNYNIDNESLQYNPCTSLSNRRVNHSFTDADKFPGTTDSDFNNLGKKDVSLQDKQNAILNCFPYVGDANINNTYVQNLRNKLMSDLEMRELEKIYIGLTNKYNDLSKELKNQMQQEYEDGGHEDANKYSLQMAELARLQKQLESVRDFKHTITKIESEKFQRYMWIGSAIALGAIAFKIIRDI